MSYYSIMIKPASSLCNLRCKYCFYADVAGIRDVPSYGIMKDETMNAILRNVEQSLVKGDQVTFAFQGGEPTLAGLDYFRKFVSLTKQWDPGVRVSYALQTNATLINEEWCKFLKEHNFLVGVSYDILSECHDGARVDTKNTGTGKTVEAALRLLEQHGVEYNVLCTLTNQVARHPKQVWNRIKQMDLKFVQFTPCLGELDKPGESIYALTPKRFASFYNQLFHDWYEDYKKSRYRSIKLFDDVVNYMAFGVPGVCGMGGRCQPQLVVEADGSVYPCDFYCLDEYKLGNLKMDGLKRLLGAPEMRAFHFRAHTQPKLCMECSLKRFCGGGCRRMQREVCCMEDSTYCGYCDFIQSNLRALQSIAHNERQFKLRHQS